MKFFTMDWWRGIQRLDHYDPIPEFQAHLATIRHQIPPDLLTLQETISLHDANVRETNFDAESNTLEMRLDADDGQGGLRQFRLRYDGVVSFRSIADCKVGLPGPHGYGDLGYQEADVTEDGKYEHRILFSTGIEFQIVFSGFTLQWRDGTLTH